MKTCKNRGAVLRRGALSIQRVSVSDRPDAPGVSCIFHDFEELFVAIGRTRLG